MTENKIQITLSEKEQLEAKLDYLKLERRSEIIGRIKIARSYGDLSENSEYESAREEQALLEKEITELEEQLRTAEIIDLTNIAKDIVSVGKRVEFLNLKTNETHTVDIVGQISVDIFAYKISKLSPVGAALTDHRVGDIVNVKTPHKEDEYKIKILSIEFSPLVK